MYDGMVDTSGLIEWSRKDETRSVGPLQPQIESGNSYSARLYAKKARRALLQCACWSL